MNRINVLKGKKVKWTIKSTHFTRTFLQIIITIRRLHYFSFRSDCSTLLHSLHNVDYVVSVIGRLFPIANSGRRFLMIPYGKSSTFTSAFLPYASENKCRCALSHKLLSKDLRVCCRNLKLFFPKQKIINFLFIFTYVIWPRHILHPCK